MNMKNRIKHFIAALFTLAAAVLPLNAEVFTSTYEVTSNITDYELISDMLIGPSVARHPKGALVSKPNGEEITTGDQVGVFSNLVASVIPSFTNGVILSTGFVTDGPSLTNTEMYAYFDQEAIHYTWDDKTDPDLNNFGGGVFLDPAGIILYIQPRNKTINIPFVMASEEFYYEFMDAPSVDLPTQETYEQYSDKFAFFIKEIGDVSDSSIYDANGNVIDDNSPMTNNIAKLPDGGYVEIASVNQHTNSRYFISNVFPNSSRGLDFPASDIKLPMEFNGAIIGPVAVAEGVDTNKIYKLKIILGDGGGENTVNSVVFLRERSITSGAE